jgi:hypothetical protein
MSKLIISICLILSTLSAFADTPAPGIVKAKVQDGAGNPIGSTAGSLNVNVTGGGAGTVTQGPPNGGGAAAWWVQGSLGRTWSLLNTTDSVNVGNFPAAFGRTWNLTSGSDSVGSVQSGIWATGRTWTLSSGSDSISAVISNFPGVQAVSQSGSPWGMNLTQLNGASFSATNYLPSRLTNGTSYVDPTQIRALSSGTDSVNVGNFPPSQTVSGTVTANAGTGTFTVGQASGANLHADIDNFPSAFGSTQSGAWTMGRTWSLLNTTDSVNSFQSGVWNLTNITGTVSLPTLASTSTKQSDGSQKTQIVDGANATVGPVQTLSGTNYMPVVLASSGTPGAAVPAKAVQIAGSDGANLQTLSTDGTGKLNANVVSAVHSTDVSSTNNLTSACTTTVNPTACGASSYLELNTQGTGGVRVEIVGTWVGTISFEGLASANATAWYPTGVVGSSLGSSVLGNSTTANGIYLFAATSGYSKLRLKFSSYTSGTAGVVMNGNSSSNATAVFQTVPANLATSVYGVNAGTQTQLSVDAAGRLSSPAGLASVNLARNDYTSTNVTTGAYVQLIASTSGTTNQLYIFDSSGQTLVLAVGGVGSEVDQAYIPPGGNGQLNLTIPSGSRVSVKAVSATATAGELNITLLK